MADEIKTTPFDMASLMAMKEKLVIRDDGSHNYNAWLVAIKVIMSIIFAKKEAYKAITEGIPFTDARWQKLKEKFETASPGVSTRSRGDTDADLPLRDATFVNDRDEAVVEINTRMTSSVLLTCTTPLT